MRAAGAPDWAPTLTAHQSVRCLSKVSWESQEIYCCRVDDVASHLGSRWVAGPVAAYELEPDHPDHRSVQMAGLIKDSTGSSVSTDPCSHFSHGVLDDDAACTAKRQVPPSVPALCLPSQRLNAHTGYSRRGWHDVCRLQGVIF